MPFREVLSIVFPRQMPSGPWLVHLKFESKHTGELQVRVVASSRLWSPAPEFGVLRGIA